MFTLWAPAEAQGSASEARAAAPVHALGSFGVLEIGGKIRVLRPVRAAAGSPLEKKQQQQLSALCGLTKCHQNSVDN